MSRHRQYQPGDIITLPKGVTVELICQTRSGLWQVKSDTNRFTIKL